MSITDKITGRVKKAAGDLADDASLRREGRQRGAQGRGEGRARRRAGARPTRKAEEVADLERKT